MHRVMENQMESRRESEEETRAALTHVHVQIFVCTNTHMHRSL